MDTWKRFKGSKDDLPAAQSSNAQRTPHCVNTSRAMRKPSPIDPKEKPLAAKTKEEIEIEREGFKKLRESI
jgi:hypothetical protein